MHANLQDVSDFQPDGRGTLPPDFIARLNLSVRASRVLRGLNLQSYSDLFSISEALLCRSPSCGKRTSAEIMVAVKNFRNQPKFEAQTEDTCPPDFIDRLKLSVRAIHVLSRMNLRSYTDLFAISQEFLSTQPNCGKKTVAEIMDAVQSLKSRFPELQPRRDFASPIRCLELPTSTVNAIRGLGIESIRDLALASDEELRRAQLDLRSLTHVRGKLCDFFVTSERAPELLEDKNPVEYLRLSVRTSKALKAFKITTVGELARVPTEEFLKLGNFGTKSLDELRGKLLNYFIQKGALDGTDRLEQIRVPNNAKVFIEKLLAELPQDLRDILIRRFGLWHRKPETLEDIGDSRGCTRERIRQLESKALASLRWPGNLKMVRCFLDRLQTKHFRPVLREGYGVATEDELRTVFLSLFTSAEEGIPVERLISKAFLNGNSIYEESCVEVQDGLFSGDERTRSEYLRIVKAVGDYLTRVQKPIPLSKVLAVACKGTSSGPSGIQEEIVSRFIRVAPSIRISDDGLFGLAQWRYMRPKTLRDMTVRALVDIGKPAHFTQIAMRVNERFCPDPPLNARNIHARLVYDQETFVWQSNGVYGLTAWGLKRAPYVKDRLVQIFKSARQPMSLDQIVPKVLETCHCNEHTPAAILEANPALFIRLDKRIYGLREWAL